ncbi:MAG: hypothetical protein ACRC5M_02875 [Anaeroplasmataceae bacterium]
MMKREHSNCIHCVLDTNLETEEVSRECTITNEKVGMYGSCPHHDYKRLDFRSNKSVINNCYEDKTLYST